MTACRSRGVRAVALLACLASPVTASAQALEITPFTGYRFGAGFFELLTRQPLDVDGARSVGVVVDVPTTSGVQFEALFTHQDADVSVPSFPYGPPVNWKMTVDHWQAGGLRELDTGPVRPFLTGSLGLTRYASAVQSEIRFALAAGGGIKLFPSEHVGFRLNGQLFATFVDADASAFACAPGICLVRLHADIIWQLEFTAGLIVRFR